MENNSETTKLKVKWRINGLPNVIITPDNIVYQLPFETKGRAYTVRKIEPKTHENKIYYRINKKRYSEQKLHALVYESIEVLDINDPTVTSIPFSNNKSKN